MWDIRATDTKQNLDSLYDLLSVIRVNVVQTEYDLYKIIDAIFTDNQISSIKEFSLGPRNRIDYYIPTTHLGIEVKKGKQNKRNVYEQVNRYLEHDALKGIIIVTERKIHLPEIINKKPCVSLVLSKLWGIAI